MNAPSRIIDRPERRRLSVRDFELLVDGGAFTDCGKTELIDGDVYVMNAQWARHARAKARLFEALLERLRAIGGDLEVLSEASVRVADDNMPEPDLVLTTYQGDRAIPAESVALVVEISDTTLEADLGRKAELYAGAGVPEYWVVDLNGARVVRHDRPGAAGYERRVDISLGDRLVSATLAGVEVETNRLVG